MGRHSPTKELIGAYIPKKLKAQVELVAKLQGKTITQLLEELLQEGVERYKRLKADEK